MGWSVPHLSEESGVSDKTIWNIELGSHSPTIATLEKLAKALGCRVVDLVVDAPRRDAIIQELLEAVRSSEMGVPEAIDTLESLGVIAKRPRDGRRSPAEAAVAAAGAG
jgi:transcriptional regulator with XRE-family HTH domain